MSYNSSGDLPNLYDIFLCEVGRLEAYGIFVKIPGFKKNGLVHKSQMSNTRLEHPEDMVANGDRVYCKVISVDDEGRIGMSMKVVNQTSGSDLDPNHVQASLDEQRRKTGHVRETRRINLGAVLDTTCSKCGGKGHFAQDCFHIPGATTYELLPDIDYLRQQQEAEEEKEKEKEKEHTHHKKKKKKEKKNAKKEKKDKHHKRKHKDSAHESHSHSSGVEKQRRLSDHDEDTHHKDSRRSSDTGKYKETDKQRDRKRHVSEHDKHGSHGNSEKHHRHEDDRRHSRTESGNSRNDR